MLALFIHRWQGCGSHRRASKRGQSWSVSGGAGQRLCNIKGMQPKCLLRMPAGRPWAAPGGRPARQVKTGARAFGGALASAQHSRQPF